MPAPNRKMLPPRRAVPASVPRPQAAPARTSTPVDRSRLDAAGLVRPEFRRELSAPAGVGHVRPRSGCRGMSAGRQSDRRADAGPCRGTDSRQGRPNCRRVPWARPRSSAMKAHIPDESSARARDARSSSTTRGVISYRLLPAADGQSTEVAMTIGYTLTGMLAQFGRAGIVQDVAARLTAAFAQNLEARLGGKAPPICLPATAAGCGIAAVLRRRGPAQGPVPEAVRFAPLGANAERYCLSNNSTLGFELVLSSRPFTTAAKTEVSDDDQDESECRHGRGVRRLQDRRRFRNPEDHRLGQYRLRLSRRRSADHAPGRQPRPSRTA